MHRLKIILIPLLLIGLYPLTYSQTTELILPSEFKAMDTPNDSGKSILLVWSESPSESDNVHYVISTAGNPDGPFEKMKEIPSKGNLQTDKPGYFGFAEKTKTMHYYEVTYPINSVTN